MDGREFLTNSLAIAGSALLASRRFAETLPVAQQMPGAVPPGEIGSARFPNGFLWGMATEAYQVEGAWNLDGRANPFGAVFRTRLAIKGGATGVSLPRTRLDV